MFVIKRKNRIPKIRYIVYSYHKGERGKIKCNYCDENDKISIVVDYKNNQMYVVDNDEYQNNVIIMSKLPIVDKRGNDIYPYDILLHDRTKYLVYVDDVFNEIYLYNLEIQHFESIKKFVKTIGGKFVFDGIQYSHVWEKDEYIYALKEAEEIFKNNYNYFINNVDYENDKQENIQ